MGSQNVSLTTLMTLIPGLHNGHRSQDLLFSRLKLVIPLILSAYYFLSQFQVVMMLHWSAMASVTMRPTIQAVTMMVGTAVLRMQTYIPVLIVAVI